MILLTLGDMDEQAFPDPKKGDGAEEFSRILVVDVELDSS